LYKCDFASLFCTARWCLTQCDKKQNVSHEIATRWRFRYQWRSSMENRRGGPPRSLYTRPRAAMENTALV